MIHEIERKVHWFSWKGGNIRLHVYVRLSTGCQKIEEKLEASEFYKMVCVQNIEWM